MPYDNINLNFYNNINSIPSIFSQSGAWDDKIYVVHTTALDKVERLFLIDPWLRIDNSITKKQIENIKAHKKIG